MDAVFFDLDETILDRRSSLVDFVTWQASTMLRSEITDVEQFVRKFLALDANGRVWKDVVYQSLIDAFSISEWSCKELLANYELRFNEFCKPKVGAIEAIQALKKKGHKIGLISNGKSPFQERNFTALGIADLFNTVIISEAVGYRKPDREIFNLACNSIDVLPINSIMVGDNPEADIIGANLAGLYTIYVPSHYGQACEQANACCKQLKDLADLVDAASNKNHP